MSCREILRFYVMPVVLWPFFIAAFFILAPIGLLVFGVRMTEFLIYHALYNAEQLSYDDIVWTMKTPENHLYINCCLVVDGVLSIGNFRKLIDETLIKFQDPNGKLLYWKVTKRICPGFINYYWVDDEKFDIEDHVFELHTSRVTSKDELHNLLSQHRSKEFSFKNDSSPWEFVLIPYQENGREKTVIFCRLSHAIADGSALAYFLVNRLGKFQNDDGENKEMILKFSQIRKGFSKVDRILINLKGLWTLPVVQTDFLLSFADSNSLHVSKATGTKSITWTSPIDLAVMKSIKNRLKTTVNDVLLGCLAKSISDFFHENGTSCPSEVSVIFPFDVRSSPDEAKEFNNKLAAMVIRIPTNKTDLITTIQDTKRRMNYAKNSGEPIGSMMGWKFVSFILPRFLAKFFIFTVANKTTGSVSNLIGPQQTIVIGKHVLDTVVFWPPQTSHHSFGVAFCSYNGQIVMGIESDHAALQDPKRILNLFEENINRLVCLPNDDVIGGGGGGRGKEEMSKSAKDNPAFQQEI